jgi:hypothetical protein
VESPGAGALGGSVCQSLSDLHVQVASDHVAPEDLRDSVDELFQRLQDDGYRWKSLPRGTPFTDELLHEFNTFGLINPGEPVRTRRPALFHREQLIHKGELRRV